MDIAEKVRFWEEQQRINAALIPRVVDGAKTLASLTQQLADANGRLLALQARLAALERGRRADALVRWGTLALSLGAAAVAIALTLRGVS